MTQVRFNAFALSLLRRHRGVSTLAIVLALALVAGGCGGSGNGRLSKTQYEARVQKNGNRIQHAFLPLGSPPRSLQEFARNIKSGQDELRSTADDLASLKPPKEVAPDNRLLVRGLRSLVAKLEPLRRAAATGDQAVFRKAGSAFRNSQPLKEINDATSDMKKKGYKLGTVGR
jgi:hypothetical protein